MADVAEKVVEVPAENGGAEKAEKEEKKVVEVEEKPKEEEAEPKENGDRPKNGDTKDTNGVASDGVANKRKSGAGDATEVEGTPEKKAKVAPVVAEESEESNSTNGSTEVAA